MNLSAKKVMYVYLDKKEYEVKMETNLHKYIGGVGVGLKLLNEYIESDPIIFSVGPLNGMFPYASKTSIVLDDNGVTEDLYFGGSLSTRIKFTGLDSIVLLGRSQEPAVIDIENETVTFKSADTGLGTVGLPGRRSIISFYENKLILDMYFNPPENYLETKFKEKNISALVITGSNTYPIKHLNKYEDVYKNILKRIGEMTVSQGNYPSCSGCPVGCVLSKTGEIGGNVLTHSLVACTYAERIYADVSVVFSCLNILGYDYTHEDIESLPKLVHDISA